jgi:proline iminopeptidase
MYETATTPGDTRRYQAICITPGCSCGDQWSSLGTRAEAIPSTNLWSAHLTSMDISIPSYVLAIAAPALLTFSTACAVHTAPFHDARGRHIPGSVATMTDVMIGGVKQRLWFRGINVENPAVILLHGGPGASEAALFRHFNSDVENEFVVVYWEQRGTGRSYRPSIPPEAMTIDQFVRDLDDVVELVRDRFNKDRVVLLGHS